MKTLVSLICVLMVAGPAKAQQIASRSGPSFYVPYGVRDVPVTPVAMESSSVQPETSVTAMPEAPMPQRYPPRRGHVPQLPPPFGGYGAQGLSGTGVLVTLGIMASVLAICAISTMN